MTPGNRNPSTPLTHRIRDKPHREPKKPPLTPQIATTSDREIRYREKLNFSKRNLSAELNTVKNLGKVSQASPLFSSPPKNSKLKANPPSVPRKSTSDRGSPPFKTPPRRNLSIDISSPGITAQEKSCLPDSPHILERPSPNSTWKKPRDSVRSYPNSTPTSESSIQSPSPKMAAKNYKNIYLGSNNGKKKQGSTNPFELNFSEMRSLIADGTLNPTQKLLRIPDIRIPNQSNNKQSKEREHSNPKTNQAKDPSNYQPKHQKTRLLPADKPRNDYKNVFTNNFTNRLRTLDQVGIMERDGSNPPDQPSPSLRLKRHILLSIERQQKLYTKTFLKSLTNILKEILTNKNITNKGTHLENTATLDQVKQEVFHSNLIKLLQSHCNSYEEVIDEETKNEVTTDMAEKNTEYLLQLFQADLPDISEQISDLTSPKELSSITTNLKTIVEAYTEALHSNPTPELGLPPPPNPYDLSEKIADLEYKGDTEHSRINQLEAKVLILTNELQRVKGYTLTNSQTMEDKRLRIDNIEDRRWHNSNFKQKSDLLYDIIRDELGATVADLSDIDIVTPKSGAKFQETFAMVTLPNTQSKHNLEKSLKRLRTERIFKCFTKRPTPRMLQGEMKDTMDMIRQNAFELYNEAANKQDRPDRVIPEDDKQKIALKPVTRSGNYSAWFEVQCPQSKLAWIPINLDPEAPNPFDSYNFNEEIHNPTVREEAQKNPAYANPRNPLTGANTNPLGPKKPTKTIPQKDNTAVVDTVDDTGGDTVSDTVGDTDTPINTDIVTKYLSGVLKGDPKLEIIIAHLNKNSGPSPIKQISDLNHTGEAGSSTVSN